ncbi:DUF4041 domain-containing protein [Holdemanella biformis]
MGLFNKKELQRISELENEKTKLQLIIENQNKQLNELGAKSVIELRKEEALLKDNISQYENILGAICKTLKVAKDTVTLNEKAQELANLISNKTDELAQLGLEIKLKKEQLFDIEDKLTYQEFGLYKPRYDCMNSSEYADRIKACRKRQKDMIKSKTALTYSNNWTLDGSSKKGQAMNNDNMKMVLRAFNNECDSIIEKVKFNNLDKIQTQIEKAASAIDKLNQRNKISITTTYISLKIQELKLVYEYRKKKQEEKELLREQRAEEREQAKLQKEIEEQRKEVIKEQKHYQTAKEKYVKELESCSEERKDELLEKIKSIDEHLNEIDTDLKNIDYREANKRAGYVYIISNIGSFGENVYKIGMTRRLDPQDRVDELGDASVPFTFDVHAMIFSDDAPTLENNLHKEFDDRKVNMINGRKEFFNVTLDEIKQAVKKYNENIIEIKDIPDAEQYRESKILRQQMNNK